MEGERESRGAAVNVRIDSKDSGTEMLTAMGSSESLFSGFARRGFFLSGPVGPLTAARLFLD